MRSANDKLRDRIPKLKWSKQASEQLNWKVTFQFQYFCSSLQMRKKSVELNDIQLYALGLKLKHIETRIIETISEWSMIMII